MRDIKFRGKATTIEGFDEMGIKHSDGWIVGNLIVNEGSPWIVGNLIDIDSEYIVHEFWVKVKPESVGQYTGLKDKNGTDIYEGDIVSVKSTSEWRSHIDELYMIEFKEQDLGHHSYQQTVGWNATGISKDGKKSSFSKGTLSIFHYHEGINTEVIGNIFENPELVGAE